MNKRAAVLAGLLACGRSNEQATKDNPPVPVPPPAPPAPTPETDFEKINKLKTVDQAVAFAKPKMDDPPNKMGAGHALFALWAAKWMSWPDAVVMKNETTFASVMKDPDEARGKRLCIQGTIIEIAVVKTDNGKLFDGLMHDYSGSIYKFSAAGSTGDLVEASAARFCGIITGRYDYSNSGGGSSHAVKLVGMFDLPANKKTQ